MGSARILRAAEAGPRLGRAGDRRPGSAGGLLCLAARSRSKAMWTLKTRAAECQNRSGSVRRFRPWAASSGAVAQPMPFAGRCIPEFAYPPLPRCARSEIGKQRDLLITSSLDLFCSGRRSLRRPRASCPLKGRILWASAWRRRKCERGTCSARPRRRRLRLAAPRASPHSVPPSCPLLASPADAGIRSRPDTGLCRWVSSRADVLW